MKALILIHINLVLCTGLVGFADLVHNKGLSYEEFKIQQNK